MADVTLPVVVLSLLAVIAVVLWMRSSIKRDLAEINTQVKVASAPAQSLGSAVAGFNQSVVSLGSEITKISVQAEKIATLGEKTNSNRQAES